MFKRTAVPPVGPSKHQARRPLNMALGLKMDVPAAFRSEIRPYIDALEEQLIVVLRKLITHEYPAEVYCLSFEVFVDGFTCGFPARAFFMDRNNNEYFVYINGKASYPSPVDPEMLQVRNVYPEEIEERYAELDEDFDYWMAAFEEFAVVFVRCWEEAGGKAFTRRATIAAHDEPREFNLLTGQWQPPYSEFES